MLWECPRKKDTGQHYFFAYSIIFFLNAHKMFLQFYSNMAENGNKCFVLWFSHQTFKTDCSLHKDYITIFYKIIDRKMWQ